MINSDLHLVTIHNSDLALHCFLEFLHCSPVKSSHYPGETDRIRCILECYVVKERDTNACFI